jgi:hypothetical protein
MVEILVIPLALVLGYLAGRYRSYRLQNQSEAAVSRTLAKTFAGPTHHLLNNLTVPTENETTQIDHVLVSRVGVFVIETKHYKGWIFGDSKSPNWTQVLFKQKFRFQNPLRQNYKHVKAVQAILDFLPPGCVHSVVVFTGSAEFKTVRPEGVCRLQDLVPYLQSFAEEVMSENRLQFCVGRMECMRLALTHQTDIQHREQLARRFGNRTN